MDYYLRLGCWGGVFAVPNQVVDDYIKLASGASLKVLLYMLRNNTQPQSDEIIASKLNLSLESVEDGFAFWEQLGIISQSPIAPEPPAAQEEAVSPPPIIRETPQPTEKKAKTPHHADRLTPSEIAARITKSDSLRFLFERCEAALKKPLNATEQNTLIWFTDYLGFPPEAVIMLVEYCASIGKANSRYIETVALSWADRGISGLAEVDAEICRMNEQHTYTNRVMSILGMNRKPTTKEKELIELWRNEGHSPELVFHAYEKTVDNTGKVSFSYMAKILEGWKQLGVTSAQEADEAGKNRRKTGKNTEHSYNLDEFDALAINLVKK